MKNTKITVISYSRTGNNSALAESIASKLSARHIRYTESKPKSYFKIALDRLFNRTPKIETEIDKVDKDELVIFVSPIWMGIIASPLRAYLTQLKDTINKYYFVTLCGGGDGENSNPDILKDLEKRVGKKPIKLIEFHIADLLPKDPKPNKDYVMKYKLTDKDKKVLTSKILKVMQEKI